MSYPKDPNYGKGYPQQQQYPPNAAPPPYAPVAPQYAQYAQQAHYAYAQPPTMQHAHAPPAAPPPYAYQPAPNPGYPVQPGFPGYGPQPHVVAHGAFDSGARFDGIAGQNIPPPPPGYGPNAAQMAAAHGGTVYTTQDKSNWLTGGKGGGVSFGL